MTDERPETTAPTTTDESGNGAGSAAVALKAHKIGLAPSGEGEYYVLTFPHELSGQQLGTVIETVRDIVPGAYFHFASIAKRQEPVLLDNTMVAALGSEDVSAEVLDKLIAAFDPEIRLIGRGTLQPGQRSFEVTFKVLNFGDDTPGDAHRSLITKLQSVPQVSSVIWDGEDEFFLLVTGAYHDVWEEWTNDLAAIAGITLQLEQNRRSLGGMRLMSLSAYLKHLTGDHTSC